jgi:DNA-binding XRE family transcriptional regulator
MQNFKKIQNIQENAFTEAIAKVIQGHRVRLGISRDSLAFQVGLHKNTLYGIEVGYKRKDAPFRHQQISLLNFVHLASFCNTDPGTFLNEVIKCALEIQDE